MTLLNILTFLSENKTVVVGATVTMCEVIVIIINYVRKSRSENKRFMSEAVEEGPMTMKNKLFWSINPINLFREP